VLHCSTSIGAYYVTRRQSHTPSNLDVTVVIDVFLSYPEPSYSKRKQYANNLLAPLYPNMKKECNVAIFSSDFVVCIKEDEDSFVYNLFREFCH